MVRPAVEKDLKSIKGLLDEAFAPSRYESTLVRAVWGSGEEYFDWVWEEHGQIIAYILYTQAFRNGEHIGWHLAPVAVHPSDQARGLGSHLVAETLCQSPLADSPVFVLGDPGFYERFEFTKLQLAQCPYDPGNQHFRALRWNDGESVFEIGYSPSFKKAERALKGVEHQTG